MTLTLFRPRSFFALISSYDAGEGVKCSAFITSSVMVSLFFRENFPLRASGEQAPSGPFKRRVQLGCASKFGAGIHLRLIASISAKLRLFAYVPIVLRTRYRWSAMGKL